MSLDLGEMIRARERLEVISTEVVFAIRKSGYSHGENV